MQTFWATPPGVVLYRGTSLTSLQMRLSEGFNHYDLEHSLLRQTSTIILQPTRIKLGGWKFYL